MTTLRINCRGPHDDGFGHNFTIADMDKPAECPKCEAGEGSGKLRVLTWSL